MHQIDLSDLPDDRSKVDQVYFFTASNLSLVNSLEYNDINNLQLSIHHNGTEANRWIAIELSAPVAMHDTMGLETWIGISINDDNPDTDKRSARSITATAGQSTPLYIKSFHRLGAQRTTIVEGKCRVNGGQARIENSASLTVTILSSNTTVNLALP